jgi:hypothetical protein
MQNSECLPHRKRKSCRLAIGEPSDLRATCVAQHSPQLISSPPLQLIMGDAGGVQSASNLGMLWRPLEGSSALHSMFWAAGAEICSNSCPRHKNLLSPTFAAA